jgi:hypothetical protein
MRHSYRLAVISKVFLLLFCLIFSLFWVGAFWNIVSALRVIDKRIVAGADWVLCSTLRRVFGCGLVGGVLGVPLTFLAPGYGWRLRVSVRLSLAAIVALGSLDSRPMA